MWLVREFGISEFRMGRCCCEVDGFAAYVVYHGLGFVTVPVLICGVLKQRSRKFDALIGGITGQR